MMRGKIASTHRFFFNGPAAEHFRFPVGKSFCPYCIAYPCQLSLSHVYADHFPLVLGHQACLQGYKTTYLNMNRLIEKVTLSKLDGSYIKLLNHLERQTLIILDDFGLQPLTQEI